MEGTQNAPSANSLVEALTNGGSNGGDPKSEESVSGFGLGVGFALSPELAQKVRECRGVSSAPAVSASSLTFLKASTPVVNGTVGSLEQQQEEEQEQQQQQQQQQEGDAVLATTVQQQAAQDGESAGPSHPTAVAANGATDRPREDGTSGGYSGHGSSDSGGAGTNDYDGNDGLPEGPVGVDGDGDFEKDQLQDDDFKASAHEGHGKRSTQDRGEGEEKKNTDQAEAASAATAVVADAPDSWEEFDESTVPPAPAPAPAADVTGVATSGGNGSGVDGAPTESVRGDVGVSSCVSGKDGKEMALEQRETPEEEPEEEVLPESAPVLLVDLARVCGFRVKGAREAEIVGGKIRAALHESFAERSEELFETGSAVHSDTSRLAEELHRRTEASSMTSTWAVVEYPATFNASATAGANGGSGGGAGGVVIETSEAWAAVTTPSPCRAVEAVRIALVGTNRHLVWKRDMLEQLEAVASSERKARDERDSAERQAELDAWRERRREQLEKLIEVRPMFERRRAMAEEKLIAAGSGTGAPAGAVAGDGEAAADPVSAAVIQSLDAKLETIDDLIARLEIEEGEEGHGFVPSDEEDDGVGDDTYDYLYDEDEDEDVEDGGARKGESKEDGIRDQTAPSQTAAAAPTPPAAGAAADAEARKKARKSNKKKKKKSRPGIVEQLKAKAEGNSTGGGGAAINGAVGEDGGGVTVMEGKEESRSEEAPAPDMGLLDAVAAMILGRYPQDPRASNEQHFQKIASMHQHMKDAWLREFGRLPPK